MTWEPNHAYEAPLPDIRLKEAPASLNDIRTILAEQTAREAAMLKQAEEVEAKRVAARKAAQKSADKQAEATLFLQALTRDLLGVLRSQWTEEQEQLFSALTKAHKRFEGKRNG